jgi:hypothetical protein
MQIRPCFVKNVAREWADKLIAGRVAFSSDYLHADAGELVKEWLDRQTATIESQAAIAAEVWAKRNGLASENLPATLLHEMAAAIAEEIAQASTVQAEADRAVVSRLQYLPDDPEAGAA